MVHAEGQPLTLGTVVSANLKNSTEVMLQLDEELARTCLSHVWDFSLKWACKFFFLTFSILSYTKQTITLRSECGEEYIWSSEG